MTHMLGGTRARALAAAVAMLLWAGCGSEASSTEKATPAATKAAAVVPEELVGTWIGKLGTRPGGSVSQYPRGRYSMKILADGNVEMYTPSANPAKPCVEQEYCYTWSVKADDRGRLEISDTPDCSSSAEYSYRVKGEKLTTERVKDDCDGERPYVYNTGVVWSRQKG
jgi:hypothetical protein